MRQAIPGTNWCIRCSVFTGKVNSKQTLNFKAVGSFFVVYVCEGRGGGEGGGG